MLKRSLSGFHALSRSLIPYSTASSSSKDGIANSPMVEFLVKSVGFSEDKAASIVTKVSPKSTKKPESVINFLRSSGLDEIQIRKVVATIPSVLRSDVDKTLTPKIRAIQELGLTGSDLALFISLHPGLLIRSLKNHIFPSINILKSLIGSNQLLVRFLLKPKAQWFFSSGFLFKNLPENMLLLQQSYGVPTDKLKWLLLHRPLFLLQKTQWVDKIAKGVEEKLGIPPTSGLFLSGAAALSGISDDRLESWLGVFRSHGWSEAEIFKLLGSQPTSLHISEKQVSVRLKYFMEELGYGSDYLASHAALLSHSMEKRILPRTEFVLALKEKQLLKYKDSYSTYIRMGECEFVKKYVLPFKDEVPELCECYTQKTGSSLT